MKKYLLCMAWIAMMAAAGPCMADPPKEIAGFVLGKDIAQFASMVHMDTALPVRYAPYITEVEIRDMAEFKSGIIGYGTCAQPGKILRIKLKYAEASEKFYNRLLEKFKQRFGEPDEWRGDPFHVMLAWKWSFTDSQNNRFSLILQHNTQDAEEKLGNAVKLTCTSQIEKEQICDAARHPQRTESRQQSRKKQQRGPVDWDRLIPR